jgi:hypothetical protein
MTAGPAAGFPEGVTLARWWGRLAPRRPRALWAGHLDLTHLDALARVACPGPLDPLHRLLLRAVAATAPATPDRLDARLGLGRAALAQWLRAMDRAGLARDVGPGYALTPAGEAALATGTAARPAWERRRFTFADVPGGEPHFLPWAAPPGPPAAAGGATARWLTDAVGRPADWKARYGFPADVAGIELAAAGAGPEAWRRVVVAHAERVPVALAVVAPDGGVEQLVGFVPRGGDIDLAAPAVSLATGWDVPFPELAREPTADELRAAWHEDCAARGLTPADADGCGLEWENGCLRVHADADLRGRLAAGGGWLLVGAGRLRRAAQWWGEG